MIRLTISFAIFIFFICSCLALDEDSLLQKLSYTPVFIPKKNRIKVQFFRNYPAKEPLSIFLTNPTGRNNRGLLCKNEIMLNILMEYPFLADWSSFDATMDYLPIDFYNKYIYKDLYKVNLTDYLIISTNIKKATETGNFINLKIPLNKKSNFFNFKIYR
ncbi:MAG: hypothetical protein CSB55_05485 [Candidatus Cloacimonadota bacterium]|nr:MAG: hypothetical protein CSB55_05485 [Candidatus Cloacimonadota bacterium]